MASEFDRLMQQADDKLFGVFGESDGTYYPPEGQGPPLQHVRPSLDRNVQIAGADGMFRTVQVLAELRLSQVPKPRRGGRLVVPAGSFVLAEPIDSDGIVERWSLMPAG